MYQDSGRKFHAKFIREDDLRVLSKSRSLFFNLDVEDQDIPVNEHDSNPSRLPPKSD